MAVELQAVPLAHRVGEGAAGELVDDLERVGRVAVVVGGEDAAGGVDRLAAPLASSAQRTMSLRWTPQSLIMPPA